MPVIDYQLWSGPAKRAGNADDDPVLFDVGIHALAKRNLVNDYEVANELIALTIGQALGLPIPSGFPVNLEGHRFFCSMIIAQTGHRLPPGDAKLAVGADEIDQDERTKCIDFLLDRRQRLRELFADAQSDPDVFPKSGNSLFKIEKKDDSEPEYYI